MKPETQSLLQKARENREAAALLLQNGYADIAASRLYYAMFYTAEALLLERGQVFSSHSAVIAAFGRDFATRVAVLTGAGVGRESDVPEPLF